MTKYLFFAFFIIIGFIYRTWFDFSKALSSGDWPYLYHENIKEFSLFPKAPFLWLEPYYNLTAKLGTQFSFPWEVTEKIFWFIPFVVICSIGSYFFVYSLLSFVSKIENRRIIAGIGSLIYVSNTYILMIVGGGQMGVALAYSLTPLVLLVLIKLVNLSDFPDLNIKYHPFDNLPSTSVRLASPQALRASRARISNIKYFALAAIVLGAQLMFDPRIFLLTVFIAFLYFLFTSHQNIPIAGALKRFVLVLAFSIILNLFWIIPNVFSYKDFYNDAATAITVSTLSFAQFSNSISLLHPNWPENIFGKVYFMRSEFLIIPILGYSSLFFISKIIHSTSSGQKSKIQIKNQKTENNLTIKQFNNKTILFFALLGLLGAFFAKGVNPPFGEVYFYLSNIPGFLIFRDPTKFYLWIAISYSVLIPFGILLVQEWLESKIQRKYQIFNFSSIFLIFSVLYLLFLIRPAVLGQLSGTFKPQTLPSEYVKFRDFLNRRSENFSTLWVPKIQRFGLSSNLHPAISAEESFNMTTQSALLKELTGPNALKIVKQEEVKFVIVPFDSKGEIFVNDRKYDENERMKVEKTLDSIAWLKKIPVTDKLIVYEVVNN